MSTLAHRSFSLKLDHDPRCSGWSGRLYGRTDRGGWAILANVVAESGATETQVLTQLIGQLRERAS